MTALWPALTETFIVAAFRPALTETVIMTALWPALTETVIMTTLCPAFSKTVIMTTLWPAFRKTSHLPHRPPSTHNSLDASPLSVCNKHSIRSSPPVWQWSGNSHAQLRVRLYWITSRIENDHHISDRKWPAPNKNKTSSFLSSDILIHYWSCKLLSIWAPIQCKDDILPV